MDEILADFEALSFEDRQRVLFSLGLPNFYWWVPGEEIPTFTIE